MALSPNRDAYGAMDVLEDDGVCPLICATIIHNFAKNSARIEKGHQIWLDTVENMVDAGDFYIEIIGMASRTGSKAYNQALSERRAAAAAYYLKVMGVVDAKIHLTRGVGWDALGPDSKAGVENEADRRVHIFLWKQPIPTMTKSYRKLTVNRVRLQFA